MFNFEWSNATLFHGLYTRTDSFWENSQLQAEGVPTGAELATLEAFRDQLPPGIFTEPPFAPPVWSDQPTDRRAIRAASALLNDAGWTVGTDGLRRNADGRVLSLEMLDDSATFERIALPFVENLRRIGIDASFDLIDPAQFQQRLEDFDFDMTAGRLVMSLSPSVELNTIFGTSGASASGSLNSSGVADPVVDALIQRIIEAENRPEMEVRVRALDRVLRAMQIWVPNWHKGSHWLAYWDIFGKPATKPLYARGDDYWWFDEGKYQALRAAGALR
jgi:microcin C transport system substrate-binding protein